MPNTPPGYPIVLTADRTLMAAYDLLFDGMLAASETSTSPPLLMAGLLMPRARADAVGRAPVAPLGLRRIEAALLAGGFSTQEVIVVDDAHLGAVIGPATRVIALSSGETCGRGMNSTTMTAIAGGRSYPEVMFQRLLRAVHHHKVRAPQAKVILGGPGVWQLTDSPAARRELGIDHLITGYADGNAAEIFQALARGESMPQVILGKGPDAIPPIRGASTMGVVEISRGCGLACEFCTIARVPMRHLPAETILADIATNLATGRRNIALLSEDFFRYGAEGTRVNPPALLELLARVRQFPELRLIQLDHVNICSVAQFTDEQLRAVRDALVGTQQHEFPWVNVGVESASGALLRANGGGAKMGGVPAERWGEHCSEQLRRLSRAGFFPLVSLLVGLPGEQEEDVQRTLVWAESLREERLAIFPVLYAPLAGEGRLRLTRQHWELIRACYQFNFTWVPQMYWDNQTGAGVSLARRLFIKTLAPLKTAQWRMLFAWHASRTR